MPRFVRLLTRGLPALVGAVLLLALLAWLAMRGSLPQSSGERRLEGLSAPVRVERDALGTVTLRAENRNDISRALGFVHAQERFLQMDLQRRRAAGELAELFGSAALDMDRAARRHRMRARLQAEVGRLPAWQRETLDNYRDGVNAGLAALRVRPFAYLLTGTQPAPWRSEDTLLCIAAMAFTLNDAGNTFELAKAHMRAALPEAAFRFLTVGGGALDAPLDGSVLPEPPLPTVAEFDLRGRSAAEAGAEVPVQGSNGFVVAGELADGAALVANDMHLDLRVPNIWFRTRLVYPDPERPDTSLEITGASLPGAPAIVVGSNGHIAWGFTNSYVDTADWVRVERDAQEPARHRVAEGWAPITRHAETLHVKGGEDEVLTIEDSAWGPILAEDADGTPLALAWTAHRPGAIDLGLMRMEGAADVDEALGIAHASGIPPQNLMVGDTGGHVAWSIAGRIPRRTGTWDPSLPADWATPGNGWDGWLEPAEVPAILDPPAGRLWSANQRIVGGAALELLGDGGYDLGARAGQIRDDLMEAGHFTPATLLAIQLDDRARLMERWRELLVATLDAAPPTAQRAAMQVALGDWEGRAATASVAYRLVRAFRLDVTDAVLGGFAAAVRERDPDFTMPRLAQGEHAVWRLLELRPPHLLSADHADWQALLLASADRAGSALAELPGGIAEQRWGRRNTARIAHPLSRALPRLVARWLDMPPDELPGDSNLPRVQGPDFGASERFAVAPGKEAEGYFMMPGGQSGHPLSPYYGAGHADWVHGRPTPFLPGPAEQVLILSP